VLVVLVMVFCVAVLTGCGSSVSDEGDTAVGDVEQTEEALSAQALEDVARMVDHFYPWFESDIYRVVSLPEQPDGMALFHVVAAYKNNPDFGISFFAYRTTAAEPEGADVDGQAYYDADAAAWWIHPQTRANSLDFTFGPNPLMTEAMLDQIASYFLAAHPGKLITGITGGTNVDLTLVGIAVEELDSWHDDGYSFKSVWKLDMRESPSVWREIDFEE
jgi:hypothetical protein